MPGLLGYSDEVSVHDQIGLKLTRMLTFDVAIINLQRPPTKIRSQGLVFQLIKVHKARCGVLGHVSEVLLGGIHKCF